jgi:HemY protein
MRNVVGLILVACLAAVLATALGTNEAVISLYWNPWRVDLSLNLFLLVLCALAVVGYLLVRAATGLIGLPARAQEWRARQRERVGQQLLREGIAYLFAGRYSRAQKAALRAADVASATPGFAGQSDFRALAHLLAGISLHRLQDRTARDRQVLLVNELLGAQGSNNTIGEGASLLAAEWALDDRDAGQALSRLRALPAGVARRTLALRLRLQAARLVPEPQEALRTARMLAKHQGISKTAADGLLRSLAFDLIDTARDVEQLQRAWSQLDVADRRDPLVSAHAAKRAALLGGGSEGRQWLRPYWDSLARLAMHEREAVLEAFVACSADVPADWLPGLEAVLQKLPLDPWVSYAAGVAMCERGLWGRATRLLGDVAENTAGPLAARREAWLRLANIAERNGNTARAEQCYRALGVLDAPSRRVQ